PNGDRHNDTWNVIGINKTMYPSITINIFNRFGKLIHKMDPNGNGWDGFFNGTQQPATDYWFSAELIDSKGYIKIKKGHFSLKR
nr:T9SS type B sorting domain-containing protein [Lutibacter sp.]